MIVRQPLLLGLYGTLFRAELPAGPNQVLDPVFQLLQVVVIHAINARTPVATKYR